MPSLAHQPDVILFGGTFDPPHRGHLQCIEFATARFPDASIMMTPAAQPAGAMGEHKRPVATFEQRIEMCKMLVKNHPQVVVSNVEEDQPQPNYTLQTIRYLFSLRPDQKLSLMIGQDQLQAFPHWYEPLSILKLTNLIVVRRPGAKHLNYSLAKEAEATLRALNLPWRFEKDSFCIPSIGRCITLLDFELCPAESSAIRQYISHDQLVPSNWLSNELLDYINAHFLYRPGEHS